MGWKPISTAPKDGTKIDIWCFNGERWTDAFWHQGLGYWVMDWGGPRGERGTITPFGQPTHWMPIPERPA